MAADARPRHAISGSSSLWVSDPGCPRILWCAPSAAE